MADIGVLYPVATMQAYAQFDRGGGLHPGLRMPEDTDLNALSDLLTCGIRRDFTFLHPEIVDEKCRTEGNRLCLENRVNFEAYRVIIIPSVSVIHWSNLKKIKAFYDAGGKVIATTRLPALSAEFGDDGEISRTAANMFAPSLANVEGYTKRTNQAGGASYFIPSLNDNGVALAAALQDAMPVADVRFGPGVPRFTHLPQSGSGPPKEGQHTGMFSYIHKVKEGRHIYFMANSTDAAVETEVVLRGDLALQCWNPHDGTRKDVNTRIITEHGILCTQAHLKLDALKTVFLVEKK
ncbi:MAG: hypothetical protein K9N55_20490 [Phycisphaerae bacterium]|nr:hypothetical protein [Phycisphaerae bacterium]